MLSGATLKYRSADFISRVSVQYARFSETGALVDTSELPYENRMVPVFPNRNGRISFEFDEDVEFVPGSVSVALPEGKKVDCELSSYERDAYLPPVSGDPVARTAKHTSLVCVPKSPLPAGAPVRFVVSKSVSKSLGADVSKEFVAAPEMAVSDFKLLSPTEACLYSATPLANEPSFLKTEPASKVREITEDGTWEWRDGNYAQRFACPKIAGKRAYVASVRLRANTPYAFSLAKGFPDAYGNVLASDVPLGTATSGNLSDRDRYLYSNALRDVNVLPDDVPVVLGMKTVNLDTVTLEACETSAGEYFRFLSNRWESGYSPDCQFSKKTVPVQNRGWDLSPATVDVAEILGRTPSSPFVVVRGSVRDAFNLHPEGYREDGKEFLNFYVRSNLALTLETANPQSYVFATSFDGKDVPSDLAFETYRYDGNARKLVPMKLPVSFDAKRSAYSFAAPKEWGVALLVAKNAKFFGVVSPNTDEASNYDFGYVSGADSSARDYAYVYSDRPIYRAGDHVSVKGIVRRFNPAGYGTSAFRKMKIRILDQEYRVFKEFEAPLDAASNFRFEFDLPKEAKSGKYAFEAFADTGDFVVTDANFHVEAYSKPVFRTTVSDEGKRDVLPGEKMSVPFESEYYFGGKVPNAEYRVLAHSQKYFFNPKDFLEYRFGTDASSFNCLYWGACSYSDTLEDAKLGRTDGNGRGIVSYEFPKTDAGTGTWENPEKIYTFSVEVTDPDTGKTVTQAFSKVAHATDAYVGIRTPYWTSKGQPIKAEGVALSHDGAPVSGKRATFAFVRTEWKEVKKQGIDGAFYGEYERSETVEKEIEATSDSEGRLRAEYLPASGGEFEIRLTYVGKNGAKWVSADSAYVATDEYLLWNSGNASVTELTAEKTVVKPGETAVFTLKSPVRSGRLFVTVEKDDAVLSVFSRDVTSYGERIEIPVDASHIPNVYVRAYVIGKEGDSPLPVYKRALSALKVVSEEKRLSVEVKTDRSRYAPGDAPSVTVFVKDALGNPVKGANGSLAVVDESVLALMGNPKKNPFAFFYEMKRYLGVRVAHSLSYLVDRLEVKQNALADGAKGGAGEDRKGGDAKKKRGVFKDTAFWQADFVTDGSGKATIDVAKLPDNLTTWVFETVVSTSPDTRVGFGETTAVTAQEVMVNDNLPRFFRADDSVTLAPVVFNRTGKDREFEVSVASEFLDVSGKKKAFVKNGESKAVSFEAKVRPLRSLANEAEYAKISVEVVSEGVSDAIEKTLPVVRGDTLESVATIGSTDDASFDETLNLRGIDRNRATLSVRYGGSLFANATDGLSNLLRYPYGCVEQRTSAVVPHVVTKRLYDSLGVPYDLNAVTVDAYSDAREGVKKKTVREVLSDYVSTLGAYRHSGGGLAYWPASESADFRMTAYVLPVLAEIRSLGIAVDPAVFADASAYLKREFYENRRPYCVPSVGNDCKYSERERLAAIVAVLAAKGDDYEAYKMYKLVTVAKPSASDQVAELSAIAGLSNIPSLSDAEKTSLWKRSKELVDILLKTSLVYESRGAFLDAGTEASRTETTARFVEALSELRMDGAETSQILDNLTRFLSRMKQSDGSYGSTLETSAVVRAFAARASASAASGTNFVAKGSVNGEKVFETAIGKPDVVKTFEARLDLAKLPDDSVVNFSKSGSGRLYYDLSLTYGVASDRIGARDEGFLVRVAYYDLNEYRRVEALKKAEWEKYLAGSGSYSSLRYPKEVSEYVEPLKTFSVGKLVLAKYRVITAEGRDRVAFESFVPSGTELVNSRLSTESKDASADSFFDREELLDDRYFGYSEYLSAGDYEGSYVLRPTHAGNFSVAPARAFEFYAPEVFGRSDGKRVEVRR